MEIEEMEDEKDLFCGDCWKEIGKKFALLEIYQLEQHTYIALAKVRFCDCICLVHSLKEGKNILDKFSYDLPDKRDQIPLYYELEDDDYIKLKDDKAEYIRCWNCNKGVNSAGNSHVLVNMLYHSNNTGGMLRSLFLCSTDCLKQTLDEFPEDYEIQERIFKSQNDIEKPYETKKDKEDNVVLREQIEEAFKEFYRNLDGSAVSVKEISEKIKKGEIAKDQEVVLRSDVNQMLYDSFLYGTELDFSLTLL